jgi:RNA polymerase sigma factor (sigma-70 family)
MYLADRARLFTEGGGTWLAVPGQGVRLLSAEGPEGLRPQVRPRSGDDAAPRSPRRDADAAVALLYDTYSRPLTRLAALLASDEVLAQEIVCEAFVAMHAAWRELHDNERALRYLQEAVVRRSRSRRRTPGATGGPTSGRPTARMPTLASRPAGEQQALAAPGSSIVAALRSLPVSQREALVLRYYADLPETRIASVMGISRREVNSHIAYGMSSLQAVLGLH